MNKGTLMYTELRMWLSMNYPEIHEKYKKEALKEHLEMWENYMKSAHLRTDGEKNEKI